MKILSVYDNSFTVVKKIYNKQKNIIFFRDILWYYHVVGGNFGNYITNRS